MHRRWVNFQASLTINGMSEGVYRHRKNSWKIKWDEPRVLGGERRTRIKIVRGTKKEAITERRRILRSLDEGCYEAPSTMTITELLDRWLRDVVQPNTSVRTYERAEERVRLHLKPAFGNLRVQALRATTIQAQYAEWRRTGRVDGRGGRAMPIFG